MSFKEVSKLRLETLNKQGNTENILPKLQDKSLKSIIEQSHLVIFDIINDLIKLRSIVDLPEIFLREDRIFYLGLYSLGISCFMKILTPDQK